jgi:hypothetical protein
VGDAAVVLEQGTTLFLCPLHSPSLPIKEAVAHFVARPQGLTDYQKLSEHYSGCSIMPFIIMSCIEPYLM